MFFKRIENSIRHLKGNKGGPVFKIMIENYCVLQILYLVIFHGRKLINNKENSSFRVGS